MSAPAQRLPRFLEKARALPATPGVYLMKDAQGRVLYVGKAARLNDPVEDFSFHGKHIPSCFYFSASSPRVPPPTPSCTSEFDYNDDALPIGIELMCRLAVSS